MRANIPTIDCASPNPWTVTKTRSLYNIDIKRYFKNISWQIQNLSVFESRLEFSFHFVSDFKDKVRHIS